MKEYTCQILWSTRVKPDHIFKMLSSERIRALLNCGRIRLALYPYDAIEAMRDYYTISLIKPHGYIFNIHHDPINNFVAHIKVPDQYVPNYECIMDPVVHPSMIGDPNDPESFIIANFYMWERNQLNMDKLYDGYNYPEEANVGPEIHIPDLAKANKEAIERLNVPIVKWIDLENEGLCNDTSSIINKEES